MTPYIHAYFTDTNDTQQKLPGKIKSNAELTLEEKAEFRVEQGIENKAEQSVEKAAEDAANEQYAASLLAMQQQNPHSQPPALNIDDARDINSARSMTLPLQTLAEITPVPLVPAPMPEPVQKKKQYTPAELHAFEIAAESVVECEVEINSERATERAVEENSFVGAEILGRRIVTVDPVADVVARRAAPGAFINPVTKRIEVPKVEERVDPIAVAQSFQAQNEEVKNVAELVDQTKAPMPTTVAQGQVLVVPEQKVDIKSIGETVEEVKIPLPTTATLLEQLEKQRQQCLWLTRKQPKSKGREATLQTKYGSMEPKERAFAILLDLEMIISHPDPAASTYDRTFDNNIAPLGEWL